MKYFSLFVLFILLIATKIHAENKISLKNLMIKHRGELQMCSKMTGINDKRCFKNDVWISELDNKNGYAKLFYLGEGYLEYFLFRGNDKDLLVFVSWGCGPICTQEVKYLEYNNGKLKGGTKDVLFNSQLKIKLSKGKEYNILFPKKGLVSKVIKVGEQEMQKELFKFKWNKVKFQFE